MPQPRLPARKLKRMFALYEEGHLSKRQTARRIGISWSTLWKYLRLYGRCRILYPDILGLNDREFLAKLLPHKEKARGYPRRAILLRDMFPSVATQLASGRANLRGMWAQYLHDNQDGYRYTQYVAHYRAWQKATGQSSFPPNKWHISHIPENDMKVLKAWRRSSDRRRWERAVAIMDLHAGSGLDRLCSKIERSRGVVKRWIAGYLNGGLAGVPQRQIKELSSETISQIEEKKHRLIEILHQSPSLYNVNRTSWSLKTLAETYRVEYGQSISKTTISAYVRLMGYRFRTAKRVLTSPDPEFRAKLQEITRILSHLGPHEKFFSIDEYGPFAVKMQGGRTLIQMGTIRTVPQWQRIKGRLIVTAALELSTNQVTHFYSERKNTEEMIKLLMVLLKQYAGETCIYFSWDAASWHASNELYERVKEVNSRAYRKNHGTPLVKLAPLPASAQFLNVIESVFSGMAKAIIHNSNYGSVGECKRAIDRYFAERNQHFKDNPRRAGQKIWGKELVKSEFSPLNNCKDPNWR